MPDAAYKRCSLCKRSKPLDAFNRDKQMTLGRTSGCRECLHIRQRYPRVYVARPCECGCGAPIYPKHGKKNRFKPGHYIRGGSPVLQRGPSKDPEEIAWAAGLFEGEGCFTMSRRSKTLMYANAAMNMTDHDIMERFHEIVGLGVLRGPETRGSGKPRWIWTVGRYEDVATVALLFAPWLGSRRLVRAASVLASDTRGATV